MRLFLLLIFSLAHFISLLEGYTPVEQGCKRRSCYPATGNLLIGRGDYRNETSIWDETLNATRKLEKRGLQATSSCGLQRKEKYCILSHLDLTTADNELDKCFWCDSRIDERGVGEMNDPAVSKNPFESHQVKHIVYRWEKEGAPRAEQYRTWWQAENGVENVTIQLDLEAEFHVTHIIITYKTFRPKAMYIEKSFDWGKSWTKTRYFAHDCAKYFKTDDNGQPIRIGAPRSLSEKVCQERYSRIVPSTQGTVIYRVLPPNINIHSENFQPYSKPVQDLLKTTNIRVVMTAMHTLGDENLNLIEHKRKYYYSIYDMTVRGSCSCYGHAESCMPETAEDEEITQMVHGKCNCTHNTMGNNCEYCKPLYNDLAWKPAEGKNRNECKKCNCNDHAEKCKFDERVYQANKDRGISDSGGVCQDCTGNTEGYQCDSCITFYYQDPALELNHPEICKPCDCEPDGTTDGGECDKSTDEENGEVAGRCHCKTFTGGKRCDHCKNGYWNFTIENEDGCQACSCDIRGIRTGRTDDDSGAGCDEATGECSCKEHVIGRDCNQCKPQHYGLSAENPSGCTPCACDIGGAYDNDCDVISGKCKCRPNIEGRQCNEVPDGFFMGGLDYLVFEAESVTKKSKNPPTVVEIREPTSTASKDVVGSTPWTGIGFMQVFEGSSLTFEIPSIFRTLEYRLVVRYEHRNEFPNKWEKTTFELISLDGDASGKCNVTTKPARQMDHECGSGIPEDNSTTILKCAEFSMSPDELYTVLDDLDHLEFTPLDLCLEGGKRYELKFTFDQYDLGAPNPKSTINIDSIALIPQVDSMDNFNRTDSDDEIQILVDNNCGDYFANATQFCTDRYIPDACKGPLESMSMYSYGGGFAKACECDRTGSDSTICNKYCGQCPCKDNVVGRRCDTCAWGYFGFSADGCTACDCHPEGAYDNFCDKRDGKCRCQEDKNAHGRRCNECEAGFWGFPDCKPCECNGHADICKAEDGECLGCRDDTTGVHCEVCLEGYYGEPTLESKIPCRQCLCPNTRASRHSFADTCALDPATNNSVCHCKEEYKRPRCDTCNDNYYGDPRNPVGSCQVCNCSDNWNFQDSGNCDPSSGECLKCLFNTAGDHCEYCEDGYYGNAVNGGGCQECVCDPLGTDPSGVACNRLTGQCNCLPNVEGEECDRCIEDHWKIASGEGCEPCACDPIGSLNMTCNEYTGKCECKEGFGGRACDLCKDLYWGNPRSDTCLPCNCNEKGSDSYQCNSTTGQCICLAGISGDKCDQCARGHVQEAEITPEQQVLTRTIPNGADPQCVECGECFDNWDRILIDLREKTEDMVNRAKTVESTGATGAYTRQFEQMESDLLEIQTILDSASISNSELVDLKQRIDLASDMLKQTTTNLTRLDDDLTDTKQSIEKGQSQLDWLKEDSDKLIQDGLEMKDEITKLQETNVEGALNLTKEAQKKSQEAADEVARIEAQDGPLEMSKQNRKNTQRIMANSGVEFKQKQEENQERLQVVNQQIRKLENDIPPLNKQVCDGTTSVEEPCDSLCGGAGCGKCGGLSCLEGALSKATEAVNSAKYADKVLLEKDVQAERVLNEVRRTHDKSERAEKEAQSAYDIANQAKERSMGELQSVTEVTQRIENFASSDQPTPENVKKLADECMAAELRLDDNKITEIANEINNAIGGIANVEQILLDTQPDLETAQQLSQRAKEAERLAQEQLENANKVTDDLSRALEAQNRADVSIQTTQTDIDSARKDLAQIASEMEDATNAADQSVVDVGILAVRQQQLQTEYIKNENRVNSARDAAQDAKQQALQANNDLYLLNTGFKNVSSTLRAKDDYIGTAKSTAMDLQRRANALSNSATNKLANLYDIEKEFEENERRLIELSTELVKLNCEMKIHLDVIEEKSNYYRTCESGGTWEPTESCVCTSGQFEPTCEATR